MARVRYDVFITHAWRYHADWTALSTLLEGDTEALWRNYSIPWYDPAFDPNTPIGRDHLHVWLESQIRPVQAVLFLTGVHAVNSARKWLDLELEMARRLAKPVIALPPVGAEAVAPEAAALADRTAGWNLAALRAAVAATIS